MNDKNFGLRETIAKSELPVLAEFSADYCGYCKRIGPAIERLAEKHSGKFTLYVCDTQAETDIAELYEIEAVPSFILFRNGEASDTLVGPGDAEQVENWLKDHGVLAQ